MYTSQTPGTGNAGQTNPFPQSVSASQGFIMVQLSDNFQRQYGMRATLRAPNSGSNLLVASAGLTVGQPYVITVLGTTSLAQWNVLGLKPGITPALGVSFVAAATSCTGTGAVQLPTFSGIDHIEVVGDPNLSIGPTPVGPSPNVGGWLLLECLATTTLTKPTDGTVINLEFYLSQSSVRVAGE